MIFLIAGRDTTAQALSWSLWLVMGHPEVEAKILEEIREVCGDGPITVVNSSKLRYLNNVINEGLRLYPSVPLETKLCVAVDVLPDGTFVPGGTVIQFSPYVMGRSKERSHLPISQLAPLAGGAAPRSAVDACLRVLGTSKQVKVHPTDRLRYVHGTCTATTCWWTP